MSQKITRKPTTARKAAAARGTERKVRAAKAKTGSAIGSAMALVPISEERLHQVLLAIILGGAVTLAWIVASFAGIPALAQRQLAVVASDAGFKVNHISVRGTKHLNEIKVYERVLGEHDRSMTTVDLAALRAELTQLSWVEDARVSRQLPDALVIDIVERVPHAVLRKADKLVLIDAAGHELEVVGAARARSMLVLKGMGAGRQVASLTKLLGAAPALEPQVREAEWIGNRRWNLTFKTGQVLALPEGGRLSANALMHFARLDGTNRLLGGKVAAFDMRAPDRIYLRLPARTDDAATPAATASPAKATAKPAAKPPETE